MIKNPIGNRQDKNIIFLLISTILFVFFTNCASFGSTKSNIPFKGNTSPSVLNDLAQKNPLLMQELGKLPELQDGISTEEVKALRI